MPSLLLYLSYDFKPITEGILNEFKGYAVKGFRKVYLNHEAGEVVGFCVLEEVKGIPGNVSNESVR